MPTYVYECAKCGDEFELWQAFTDDSLKKHPECGGKVAKVIQPAGIVLKGSGFYKNDSRSGSKRSTRPAAAGDSKSGSDGGSDSSSSTSDTGVSSSGS
jgi:putative FmdB family regulatory protein